MKRADMTDFGWRVYIHARITERIYELTGATR